MKTIVYYLGFLMLLMMAVAVSAITCSVCSETCSPCVGECTATDMISMYQGVTNFDAIYGDITGWDTSCITNMDTMFVGSDFNQDISGWDTSSVTDMTGMFNGATAFNQDISGWDTSSVVYMSGMFYGSTMFDQDIGNWDVSNLLDADAMFVGSALSTSNYDAILIGWSVQPVQDAVPFGADTQYTAVGKTGRDTLTDTYHWTITDGGPAPEPETCAICTETCSPCGGGCTATDMYRMFADVKDFDTEIGDITGWDTSCITDMSYMFQSSDFNQDISKWDTSSVSDMSGMFSGDLSFNQPIGSWDTSSVTDMSSMFINSHFNQPVEEWGTGSVADMSSMFAQSDFNQDVSGWDVTNVLDMTEMFYATTLSTTNYDALLLSWSSQIVHNGINFNAGNSQYSEFGKVGIDRLITQFGWTISDGGLDPCVPHWVCSNFDDCIDGTKVCLYLEDLNNCQEGFDGNMGDYDKVCGSDRMDCDGHAIDEIAPTTAYSAPSGWRNSDVTVNLAATDPLCGVQATFYCVDQSNTCKPNTVGTVVTVSAEGTNYMRFLSIDNSKFGSGFDGYVIGNVEAVNSAEVRIDKTAPSISITTPTNFALYIVGTPLVFSATDSLSGVASVTGELTNTSGTTSGKASGFVPQEGVYTLIVKAVDNAGNSATSNAINFVVYDPSGGFATGGGWITPDSESTPPGGKASFGFVAKYKDKAANGNLEFQYKDANVNLKSTSIDWLVISGVSAQFQGTATINGQGSYTFRVLAKDNGEPGAGRDNFDIRIWTGTDTTADPVHKAKNTISGGNIVVHKK